MLGFQTPLPSPGRPTAPLSPLETEAPPREWLLSHQPASVPKAGPGNCFFFFFFLSHITWCLVTLRKLRVPF